MIADRHADLADAKAALLAGGGARGDRRRRQRLRHAGRRRLAGPARGAGAAAPRRPGPGGGAHRVPRALRRPSSTPAATTLTDELADTLRGWGELLARRGVAAVSRPPAPPGCRRGCSRAVGRRATAHRPAAPGRDPARGGADRAARAGRAAGLAAARGGRRARGRPRGRAHPAARQRRSRRPARHHPRQQGPGVPRRLPARPGRPVGAEADRDPALPRRPGPPQSPRRQRRGRLDRGGRPGARGGGRRVAAAAVRRHDAGQVAGRGLVGAQLQRAGVAAAPDPARPRTRRGRGAPDVRGPH